MRTKGLALVRGGAGLVEETASQIGVHGSEPVSQSTQRVRIVDGALCCIARQGIAKTTLDDVAREARCSRATVYRVFPGGKDALLAAVVDTEVSRLFSALAVRMGEAETLEEVLVAGMSEAARRVNEHRALSYLLEYEPSVVLPQLAFERMDALLAVSSTFTAPFLGRWMDHDEAHRVAEWAARIVLSYLACPADGIDLADPDRTRHLVRTFVLPGIRALCATEEEKPSRARSAARDASRTAGRRGAGASRRPRTGAASAGRRRASGTTRSSTGGKPHTTSAHDTDKGEAS